MYDAGACRLATCMAIQGCSTQFNVAIVRAEVALESRTPHPLPASIYLHLTSGRWHGKPTRLFPSAIDGPKNFQSGPVSSPGGWSRHLISSAAGCGPPIMPEHCSICSGIAWSATTATTHSN